MTISTNTQNVIYDNFDVLAAALTYAHNQDVEYHYAAALLVVRCNEILNNETYVAPKTITSKVLSAIESNTPMDTLICCSADKMPSELWQFRLQQFVTITADLSTAQQAAALFLVLQNNVRRESDTTFIVDGSKPYLVTLQNGVSLADGFGCRCKGFWSHGGGNVCKHIAAAFVIALDPVELLITL